MSLARRFTRIERELEGIVSIQDKQVHLLKQMEDLCGSDFSAFNLMDRELRIVGGIAWPITEERIRQMQTLNPVLGALLKSSPVSEALRFGKPKKAVAIDSDLLHSSLIYREVYEPMGMHHLGTFVYPGNSDYIVGVGISSSTTAFTGAQIRVLERLCLHFESLISQELQSVGPVLSIAKPGDWRVELTKSLECPSMPDHMLGLLASFYGGVSEWAQSGKLPSDLLNDLQLSLTKKEGSSIPIGGSGLVSFSRMRKGRRLNIFLEGTSKGDGYTLTCAEDLEAEEFLQRLSDHCAGLKRDSYAVYRACITLLDGVRGDEAILQAASLLGLKTSSSRRIISRAKSVLEEVRKLS